MAAPTIKSLFKLLIYEPHGNKQHKIVNDRISGSVNELQVHQTSLVPSDEDQLLINCGHNELVDL